MDVLTLFLAVIVFIFALISAYMVIIGPKYDRSQYALWAIVALLASATLAGII